MTAMMGDRRLLACVGAALLALAAGVVAVVLDVAALGIAAGVAGVAAAAAGVALAAQLRTTEDRLRSADDDVRRLHRELDAVSTILEQEAPPPSRPRRPGVEPAFDDTTGLYDERYFAVLVQQQVAAARRSLRPLSVVIFEADGIADSDPATRRRALGALGDAVRRTLRECDSACRLGETMIGAVLEDTSEAGGVWAAERVRGALLALADDHPLTVSAGVACYPSHALGAAELVSAAGRALEGARASGSDRVETAPEA